MLSRCSWLRPKSKRVLGEEQDKITINVSGERFQTHRTTLELYPNTLLGNKKKCRPFFDKAHKEYFFDRHRASFHAILYYYQSQGRLRRPPSVPLDTFLEEVTFFELDSEALQQVRDHENVKEAPKLPLPKNRCRRYLWANMEYPQYSTTAKVINFLSMLVIVLSCIALAIETLPKYNGYYDNMCEHVFELSKNESISINKTVKTDRLCAPSFYNPFFVIQTFCIISFTTEFIVRLMSTPRYLNYIKDLMNWIDVLAIIPYYITLGIMLAGKQDDINANTYGGLKFLRLLRFVRIFKLYRVFRIFKTFRILASAFKESLPDFFIMMIILTFLGFLFGAGAYFAEQNSNGVQFDSIPKATYWGIITVTSTGYGDMYPITAIGRTLGCLCAIFGQAAIGMAVSVLVDRYQRVYTRKLYIDAKDDEMEFYESSDDDDDDDIESQTGVNSKQHKKDIGADPDALAREEKKTNGNYGVENDDDNDDDNDNQDQDNEVDYQQKKGSKIKFILTVDNDEDETLVAELFRKMNKFIRERQQSNENQIDEQQTGHTQESQISSEEINFVNNNSNGHNVLIKFRLPSSTYQNETAVKDKDLSRL
ncbi:unnamed protein product [Didymodactylos carnosus]|uniref:BTB domain-containing protein n=1 Tax=Didymodactylos carnosus TaxID=1234261 RepID=A0A8S2I953_9BILA|nr:unnamed protein product [Didymodactylos carnosus]CAF3716986.1 unnamed protein product [Didymodactylos carnosus]